MATRIKGKNVLFELDGTDYSGSVSSVVLENEPADNDVTTFADARSGGAVQWKFTLSGIQSTDTDALWKFLWDHAGEEDVEFVFAPRGNATPSTSQPHYTGTVTMGAKPSIGGEAGASTTWTFDAEILVDAEPTVVTA